MKIRPIRDQILVEILKIKDFFETKSGIVISRSEDTTSPKMMQVGKVIAIGDGELFQDPTKKMNINQLNKSIICLNKRQTNLIINYQLSKHWKNYRHPKTGFPDCR